MDENVNAFLRVLDAEDNSTGGGTASAVAGSMAAALVAMVARLSIGRDGMKSENFYRSISMEAEDLSKKLFNGGRQDCLAFDGVKAAYRLPKETAEQKEARREAVQSAIVKATRVPLDNAENCSRVLELKKQLDGCSNPNAASDLECAGFLARAGLLGCLANVTINLPGVKDPALAESLEGRAEALYQAVH